MNLIITDNKRNRKLKEKYCIPLELIFNKSEYGKEWSFIGDHLFYFKYPNEFGKNKKVSNILILTSEQYSFLEKIIINNNFI